MHALVYLIIGALSGTLAGLLGLGGGVVVVPALVAVFGYYHMIPPDAIMRVAIGTSLVTIVVTFLASLMAHASRNTIRWDYVKAMWPGLVLGAVLGSIVAKYLPTHFLKLFFALFLFFTAVRLLMDKSTAVDEMSPPSRILVGVMSLITGSLSGILGVGGGAFLIPFLLRCKLSMRQASGTSVVAGLLISVVASVSFMWLGWSLVHLPGCIGYVYWPAFIGVSTSSIVFAPVAANLAYRLPTDRLKKLFAGCLFVLAIQML